MPKRKSTNQDSDMPPTQSRRLSQIDLKAGGVIMKLTLTDFMCHEAMEIDLNANINFVVGRNGSGKSAITNALVVGLGGSARDTNRGRSVIDFVKNGAQKAVVEITLNNAGPLGYKKDLYGDRILVVRTLSSGSSGYKIKAANGRIVSTKREELLRVCAALNIQVDNPVSVLNQDTSRTFLNSSDPGDKYSLFVRATQLDEIERLITRAVAVKQRAENALNVKRATLAVNKEELDALRKRWEALKTVPEHRRRIKALENELLWACALEKESLQAAALEQQAEQEGVLLLMKRQVEAKAENEQVLLCQMRQNETQLAALQDESADLVLRFAAAKDMFRRSKEAHGNRLREQKAAEAKVKRQLVDVNTLREEIDRIEQESGQGVARRAAARAQLLQLEEQHSVAQDTLRDCTQRYSQLRDSEEPIRAQISSAKADIKDKTTKMEKITKNLKEMQLTSKSSNVSIFNPRLPKLMAAIDRAHARGLFHRKPVGPIGAYVKLRDATWAAAMEQVVGKNFFSSICVHDKEDETTLYRIVDQELGSRVGIFVQRGLFIDQVHDVSRHKVVVPGLMSLLDSLIITDPIVANAVIDSQSAEGVLLIPTAEQAYPLMDNKDNVPANCWRAITKRGEQFFPAPKYRSYAGNPKYTRAKFLQVSVRDAIIDLQRELESATQDKVSAEKTYRTLTAQLSVLETESRKVRGERDQAVQVEQRLAAEIASSRNAEEPEQQCIVTLGEDLAESEAAMAEAVAEERLMEADVVLLKQNMEEARQAALDLDKAAQAANTQEQPILARAETLCSDVRACKLDQQHCAERVKAQEALVHAAARRATVCAEVAGEYVRNAAQLCARIDTRRGKEDVEDEMKGLAEILAATERQGSYLEVTDMYLKADVRHKKMEKNVNKIHATIQTATTALNLRAKVFSELQEQLTLSVQEEFEIYMSLRGFKGNICIDHEAKTLDLLVTPAHRSSAHDTRTLSGGERSFATVSFLIALWHCVNVPFYFLDEFEIYMDKVNRRYIMDFLIEFARRHPEKQFVFLTPQDISHVVSDDAVTIHRMEDPRR